MLPRQNPYSLRLALAFAFAVCGRLASAQTGPAGFPVDSFNAHAAIAQWMAAYDRAAWRALTPYGRFPIPSVQDSAPNGSVIRQKGAGTACMVDMTRPVTNTTLSCIWLKVTQGTGERGSQ
jgi:hypothetical protein